MLLAEMFAAKQGLGFLIINAMQLLQAEEMLSGRGGAVCVCGARQCAAAVDRAPAASESLERAEIDGTRSIIHGVT